MKKTNVALLLLIAAGAGVGAAATLIDRIGFNVSPPPYAASTVDADHQR